MAGASLPPGFRFHPTDEELLSYYLKRKVDGVRIELQVIPEIELYKFDPWELPDKSFLPKRDMEWFFFCPRDRKYPNGSRTNRATRAGYWKATGKDRKVTCQSDVIGYRKTLVFYRGRAPLGDRTDWVMHEYRLCDNIPQGSSASQGAFALCRVVKRNEPGQKIGELQGESKSMKVGSSSASGIFTPTVYSESSYSSPASSPYDNGKLGDLEPSLTETRLSSPWISPDMILDTSKMLTQGRDVSECLPSYDHSTFQAPWQSEFSATPSYSNVAQEAGLANDFGRVSCMSPYSQPNSYMGFCDDGDVTYQSFDQTDSLTHPSSWNNGFEAWNPLTSPQICRQTSGDGSQGDFGSLWLQEDNLLVMI